MQKGGGGGGGVLNGDINHSNTHGLYWEHTLMHYWHLKHQMCEKQTDLYTIKEGMCEWQVSVLNAFIKMDLVPHKMLPLLKHQIQATRNLKHIYIYIYNKKFNKIYKDCINIIFYCS